MHEGRYLKIKVDGKEYRAHRLAWLYMHDRFPRESIDHIDGDCLNNRLSNLREATRSQNNFNSKGKARKHSLPRGVNLIPRSVRYEARISIRNKKKYLGAFDTPEEAGEFYQLAADLLHGEFAFHRCQGVSKRAQAQKEQSK